MAMLLALGSYGSVKAAGELSIVYNSISPPESAYPVLPPATVTSVFTATCLATSGCDDQKIIVQLPAFTGVYATNITVNKTGWTCSYSAAPYRAICNNPNVVAQNYNATMTVVWKMDSYVYCRESLATYASYLSRFPSGPIVSNSTVSTKKIACAGT